MLWTRDDIETVHEFRIFLKQHAPHKLADFDNMPSERQWWCAQQFFRFWDATPDQRQEIRQEFGLPKKPGGGK